MERSPDFKNLDRPREGNQRFCCGVLGSGDQGVGLVGLCGSDQLRKCRICVHFLLSLGGKCDQLT